MSNQLSKRKDRKKLRKAVKRVIIVAEDDYPIAIESLRQDEDKDRVKNCDQDIHDILIDMECGGLISLDNDMCPFCNEKKFESKTRKIELCCDKQNLIYDNGEVCTNCGVINFYSKYEMPYIDFHENKYSFRGKTIYNRKHHIENVLNNLNLNHEQKEKIQKIFKLIDKIIISINNDHKRKRIINVEFMVSKILQMMNIKYTIKITAVKTTLNQFEMYWNDILKIIDDDIQKILKRSGNQFCF